MSRRRIEAGFNATSSFSLRESNTSSYVVESTSQAPAAMPMPQQTQTIQPPQPKSFASPISFSIGKLGKTPPCLPTQTTTSAPNLSGLTFKLNGISPVSSAPKSPEDNSTKPVSKNAFGMPLKQNTASTFNPEVMRLTAQSDDLRTRLKTTSERNMLLESHIQRIQKTVSKERGEFAKQLNGAREEIAALKEVEATMKKTISKLNASIEKKSSFESAVKSAMQNKEYVEAQAKLDELQSKHATVVSQIEVLEQRRCAAVQEADESIAKKAATDAEIVAAGESLKARHEEAHAIESQIDSLNTKFDEASSNLESKNQDLEQVQSMIAELETRVSSLQKKLQSCSAVKIQYAFHCKRLSDMQKSAQVEAAKETRPFSAGDDAPQGGLLGWPSDNVLKRTDDLSSMCSGMPYHFELDAPIALTANSTQMIKSNQEDSESDINTEALLAALVGDLKEFLAHASVENEKRGLNRGLQTGETAQQPSPLAVSVA